MTRSERRKYQNLLSQYGQSVADRYQSWVGAGKPGGRGSFDPTAGAPAPSSEVNPTTGNINFNNPQSVVDAQNQYNDQSTQRSTPNMSNPFGARTVTYNPDGSVSVNEDFSGANKDLYDQSVNNQRAINQTFSNALNTANSQAPFDPTKGQVSPERFAGQPWRDPRQTAIQAPQSFRDMQQRTFAESMQTYDQQTRDFDEQNQEQLLQQMANEGIGRGNEKFDRAQAQLNRQKREGREQAMRSAYRDSQDVASQAFQNQLSGQGQEFGQNLAAGDQQFGQALTTNTTRWDQGMQGNAQAFGQNMATYNLPHTIAQGYMAAQGQYQNPNFGSVQQINTPTFDVSSYGLGVNKLNQDASQFDRTLEHETWKARGNWDTSRRTAGAGSLSMAEQIGLINARAQADRDNWAWQQGFGGTPQPGTSWSDVGGAAAGGFVNGIANQVTR